MIASKHTRILSASLALLALSGSPVLAQAANNLFAAPTSFLQQIQTFVTGTGGVLLGGAAVAVMGISAASPRIPVSWGQFFVGLVVLCIFYGAFTIAGAIQSLST